MIIREGHLAGSEGFAASLTVQAALVKSTNHSGNSSSLRVQLRGAANGRQQVLNKLSQSGGRTLSATPVKIVSDLN